MIQCSWWFLPSSITKSLSFFSLLFFVSSGFHLGSLCFHGLFSFFRLIVLHGAVAWTGHDEECRTNAIWDRKGLWKPLLTSLSPFHSECVEKPDPERNIVLDSTKQWYGLGQWEAMFCWDTFRPTGRAAKLECRVTTWFNEFLWNQTKAAQIPD